MNAYGRNCALYKGHRFPAEIISHCVWVYYRFCLSLRDVSELMLARGVVVSHEAVRFWTVKFGAEYTRRLRARRGPCGDTWHLDEVFCKINGELVYLWRAVDQSGKCSMFSYSEGVASGQRNDSSTSCSRPCATVLELW